MHQTRLFHINHSKLILTFDGCLPFLIRFVERVPLMFQRNHSARETSQTSTHTCPNPAFPGRQVGFYGINGLA